MGLHERWEVNAVIASPYGRSNPPQQEQPAEKGCAIGPASTEQGDCRVAVGGGGRYWRCFDPRDTPPPKWWRCARSGTPTAWKPGGAKRAAPRAAPSP